MNNNNNPQSYKKLLIYQKSKLLVLLTYKITKKYPKEEAFILISQSRRAAISIVSNVVEGYFRKRKEFIRFLDISIGSAIELTVQLDIAYELGYLNEGEFQKISSLLLEVRKMLFSYQKSLKSKE